MALTRDIKPGDRVRLNAAGKQALRRSRSHQHIREFGNSIGTVVGLADFCGQIGPEVDVRWQPDNLHYVYHPDFLDLVTSETK